MDIVGQHQGASECLMVPGNQHNNTEYHFSYYSKYLCLATKFVEYDDTPYNCLFGWLESEDYDYDDYYIRNYNSYDMPFVTINECLIAYEKTPDTEMRLKNINGLDIYT
jgi:hypothetical protein